MKENCISALGQAVARSFAVLFSSKTRLVEVRQEESQEAPFDVSGIIGVTGPTRGTVVISFPAQVASALTSRMLNEENCLEQDIGDCVGELANILAGNLLGLFRGDGMSQSGLSTPSVVVGAHKVVWSRKSIPYDRLLFDSDMGQFAVEFNVVTASGPSIETIMIVDDSRVMRQVLKMHITEVGYDSCDFIEAADGKDALEKLEEIGYDVDVIFSDLWMPKMNGLELIEVLAGKNTPDRCRVIVVTGDLRESQCDEALKRGAYGLLTKPFATKDVAEVLESLLKSTTGELASR